MMCTLIRPVFVALTLVASVGAMSQEPPPVEELEPAVDTSADTTPAPETRPNAAPPAATPPTQAPPSASTPPPAAARQNRSGQRVMDRLELDATQITGNRELPKVLYIVPWKRSDLGDLVGRPVNSLLDEVLAPVDRDVFKRENRYYTALQPGPGGSATAGDGAAREAPPAAAPPARDER
jgi:hypothetical protein